MLQDARQWLNSGRIADVRQARSGATALHVAAAKGYSEVLRWVRTAAGTRGALSSPPPSRLAVPLPLPTLLAVPSPLPAGSSPPSSQASPGAPRGAEPGVPGGPPAVGGSSPAPLPLYRQTCIPACSVALLGWWRRFQGSCTRWGRAVAHAGGVWTPPPPRPCPALWRLRAGRARHRLLAAPCASVSRCPHCPCPGTRLLVRVVGSVLLSSGRGSLVCFSGGPHGAASVSRGSCQPPRARRLGASAGAPAGTPKVGGGRPPGEWAREEGEDEGRSPPGGAVGRAPDGALGDLCAGEDVAAPQRGLGRGASLPVAALMPEEADLGSAPGAGARGRGL